MFNGSYFLIQRLRFVKIKGLYLTAVLFLLTSKIFAQNYIDPTGTYLYNGKTIKKGDDIYGYTGQIQIRKLNSRKIVMTFEINKGAPSYSSGSFVDTLDYFKNKVTYTNSEDDSTCKIIFLFDPSGVNVKEQTANFNSGCGFGHAVVASGRFRKISSKCPKLKEPLTGELLN